jgi:hypothetical protein
MASKAPFFSKILGVELKAKKINPQLLNNDRLNYQRFRIEERVLFLIENYAGEIKKAHSIIVAKRDDGTHWIINGQHHSEAAVRLNVSSIEVYLFKSKGVNQEKKVFKNFQEWQNK